MFRVKICGITSPDDAIIAARAGADAVGLNFFPGSPRFVDDGRARSIVAALPVDIVKVGVWVNAPAGRIAETADRLNLDLIQLHGDEPPELLLKLAPRSIVRAFRCEPGVQPASDYLRECERLDCMPKMVLIDAAVPRQYGGTGHFADWKLLAARGDELLERPLVLAGGLNPHNVGQAVRLVRPAAVDVASGVESQPGRKSAELCERFVAAARRALDEMIAH